MFHLKKKEKTSQPYWKFNKSEKMMIYDNEEVSTLICRIQYANKACSVDTKVICAIYQIFWVPCLEQKLDSPTGSLMVGGATWQFWPMISKEKGRVLFSVQIISLQLQIPPAVFFPVPWLRDGGYPTGLDPKLRTMQTMTTSAGQLTSVDMKYGRDINLSV